MPWPVTFFPSGRTVHVDPGTNGSEGRSRGDELFEDTLRGARHLRQVPCAAACRPAPAAGSEASLSRAAELDAGWRAGLARRR
jgi:hypothetical protein